MQIDVDFPGGVHVDAHFGPFTVHTDQSEQDGKEELGDMHPVDLADILEELDHDKRVKVFEGLDTEHASDTLEEINPRVVQADERPGLQAVMVDNVITLDPGSTLREAAQMFARCNFRAIPVTDDDEKMLGVLMYRDVMGLKHRFVE